MFACPTCENQTTETVLYGQRVSRCETCSGTWFERKQFVRALKKAPPDPTCEAYESVQVACPQCDVEIPASAYGYDSGIAINKCKRCGGVWLRDGQLQQISAYRKSNTSFDALAAAYSEEFARDNRWRRIQAIIKSRILSGFVFVSLLLVVYLFGSGWGSVFSCVRGLIVPVAFIWFADAMGKVTGVRMGLIRPGISHETPGIVVAIGGWVVLIVFSIVVLRSLFYWQSV